jgi:hypothetical protein
MFISVPNRYRYPSKSFPFGSGSVPDPRNTLWCGRHDATCGYHRKAVIISLVLGGLQGVFRIVTVRFRIRGSEIQMLGTWWDPVSGTTLDIAYDRREQVQLTFEFFLSQVFVDYSVFLAWKRKEPKRYKLIWFQLRRDHYGTNPVGSRTKTQGLRAWD